MCLARLSCWLNDRTGKAPRMASDTGSVFINESAFIYYFSFHHRLCSPILSQPITEIVPYLSCGLRLLLPSVFFSFVTEAAAAFQTCHWGLSSLFASLPGHVAPNYPLPPSGFVCPRLAFYCPPQGLRSPLPSALTWPSCF